MEENNNQRLKFEPIDYSKMIPLKTGQVQAHDFQMQLTGGLIKSTSTCFPSYSIQGIENYPFYALESDRTIMEAFPKTKQGYRFDMSQITASKGKNWIYFLDDEGSILMKK